MWPAPQGWVVPANGFSETTLRNNLVLHPRGAAGFAWLFGAAGLVINRQAGIERVKPLRCGPLPLLPLADWRQGDVPMSKARGRQSPRRLAPSRQVTASPRARDGSP